jgi:hypothetical protein
MEIRRKIKGDWGSFPCIQDIMILYWMWIEELSSKRSVYVTLEKEEEIMQVECTFIIAMKNG